MAFYTNTQPVEVNQDTATNLNATVEQADIVFNPVNTTAPVNLSISGTSAESAQLTAGSYLMISLIDCFFRVGDTGLTAVTTDRKLIGGVPRLLIVTGTADDYVAAITSGTSETLNFEKIG